MATTKPAKKTTAKRSRSPVNAGLDDPMYVPHLDELTLPESALEGTGPDYSDMFESICGVADDSQQVELYDGTLGVTAAFVDGHQLPVAQVQWNDNLAAVFTSPGDVSGVRWGSGTMIGPDLFLTCGHLFDTDINGWTVPRQNGTSNAISPQQAATSMHLNFEYQVDENNVLRAEQSYPITQLIEYRLGGLDMAVCRIGGSPGSRYGWSEFATTNAAVGDMLAIIGHPLGQPKRIEAGPATTLSGSVIRYNDIDTLGGNSGSGILHSPSGRVVGVHTNGGCNSAGTGSNSGVAIAAIIAASPTLQATTPSAQTARAADSFATQFADDVGGTLHAADTGVRDQIGTRVAADIRDTLFARDVVGTRLTFDVKGTPLARDVGGTPLAGDVLGTLGSSDDPNLTRREAIVDLDDMWLDPAIGAALGGVRPFVQAAPHLGIGREAVQSTPGAIVLGELEAAIQSASALLESLAALHDLLSGEGGT
jgi:V8-like Glu-specific endopeptidase